MDEKQFNKRRENLRIVDVFTMYTLYYDEVDESLWLWDGENFVGVRVEDLYGELLF